MIFRCLFVLGILGGGGASLALKGQDIALFPSTEATGTPLAVVSLDDPAFEVGSLVFEEEAAAAGWHWGEYAGSLVGYVPDAKIGKDLYPVEGAYIFTEPKEESALLTTVTAQDLNENRIEIVDRGPWWKVRLTKAIPVFYQVPASSVSPTAASTSGSNPNPTPASSPSAISAPAAADDADSDTPLPLYEAPVPESPSAAPPGAVRPQSPDRSMEGSVAGSLATTMRGRLERTSKRFFLFTPPAAFELLNTSGKRIAYLDLKDAILPSALPTYLGKDVTVIGTWTEIEDSTDILIRVRTVRANPAK